MKINDSLPLNENNTELEEEKTHAGEGFDEIMKKKALLEHPSRKPSIFDMEGEKEKKTSFKEEEEDVTDLPQSVPVHNDLISNVSIETHGIAEVNELSAQLHELIDKMAHFITVESHKGVSTTTVVINMEGSVFDQSQVDIFHYDTAPHSFNLQLSGNPQATELFTSHLTTLRTSLETHETLQGFQIELLPPLLKEKSELHLRGKEKEKKISRKPLPVSSL